MSCNKIETLCKAIQKESPNTKLALSEITPRHDFKDASNAREQVNKKLEALCGAQKLSFIKHPSLTQESLNTRGIHLNYKGTAILSKNFKNFVQRC